MAARRHKDWFSRFYGDAPKVYPGTPTFQCRANKIVVSYRSPAARYDDIGIVRGIERRYDRVDVVGHRADPLGGSAERVGHRKKHRAIACGSAVCGAVCKVSSKLITAIDDGQARGAVHRNVTVSCGDRQRYPGWR
ncbi:hypothetical protein A8V01_12725 [Novosphingobium guangzhouense]|uniref:Uncharacterized protein n=1 Tax=Novosphingobium guangzhouense TaxID=1850347 RepID=A0A2K2G5F1_9SPHN|nr:hypothetical protein A8V01_12725 [Novosphingobium guangzhouense]